MAIFILALTFAVSGSKVRFKHILEISLGYTYAWVYYLNTEVNLSATSLDFSPHHYYDLIPLLRKLDCIWKQV
jgi:hypothetical protein